MKHIKKIVLLLTCILAITNYSWAAKKSNVFYFGLTKDTSILLNNEKLTVIVTLKTEGIIEGGYTRTVPFLYLKVKNNTTDVLYVDLGNSFIIRNGEAEAYYTPGATSTTTGKTGGASVNVGGVANALGVGGAAGTILNGVNVGGGKQSSTTTITYTERIIAIPPMATKELEAKPIFSLGSEAYYNNTIKTVQKKDGIAVIYRDNLDMEVGKSLDYLQEESPIKFDYFISYSTTESFDQKENVRASYYVDKVIAAKGSPWGNGAYDINDKFMDEIYPEWKKRLYFVLNRLGKNNWELQ